MSRNPLTDSYKQNLFSFFKLNELKKSSTSINVLKNSKKLILNSTSYRTYSDFYKKATTMHTFKLPNVSAYPLQQNEELISIKSNLIKSQKKQLFAYSNLKLKKNKGKSVSIDFSNNITDKPKSNNKMNENIFLQCIDQFNDMNSVIYKYISYKEKYFFNKKGDNNLHLLIDMINQNQFENDNSFVYYQKNTFDICDNKIRIDLKFYSLKIVFYDSENKKVNTIIFPFSFLPFFYGIKYDLFKSFLSFIIEYNSSTSQFELNQEKLKNYYLLFKDNTNFYIDESFMLDNNKKEYIYDFDWVIKLEANSFKKYKLKVKLPHMSFKLTNLKLFNNVISIRKNVDISYVAYFIGQNFKDWDLYLLNTFCSFRRFRDVINKALSFIQTNTENIKFDLDNLGNRPKRDVNLNTYHQFYLTIDDKTIFFTISAPQIKIVFTDKTNVTSNDYNKIFQLNLKQAVQLNKFSYYCSVKEIIKKGLDIIRKQDQKKKNILYVDNIELNINDLIFNFDESLLEFFQPLSSRESEGKGYLTVAILEPILEWKEISHNIFKRRIYKILYERYKIMFELEKEKWSEIISDILDEIKQTAIICGLHDNFSLDQTKTEESPIKSKGSSKTYKYTKYKTQEQL